MVTGPPLNPRAKSKFEFESVQAGKANVNISLEKGYFCKHFKSGCIPESSQDSSFKVFSANENYYICESMF